MGVKLPEGALHAERMKKIEERLSELERRVFGETPVPTEQVTPIVEVPGTTDHVDETAGPKANTEPDGEIVPGNVESSAPTKDDLIAKALELKSMYPRAVSAAPSQIPTMSAEKLTKLIADAETAIAAGAQE